MLTQPKPLHQKMIVDTDAGVSQADVARDLDLTPQAIQAVLRNARRNLDTLELELLKATKTNEAVGLRVPFQEQGDRHLALDYFDWVVRQLRERGIDLKV